jgi:hypothetical protein
VELVVRSEREGRLINVLKQSQKVEEWCGVGRTEQWWLIDVEDGSREVTGRRQWKTTKSREEWIAKWIKVMRAL